LLASSIIALVASLLRLSFSKNELFGVKFAHHENGRVVGLIDLASPTIYLKSSGSAFEGKASLQRTGGRMREWTNGFFGKAGHYDDQSRRFWVLTALTQPHKLTLATSKIPIGTIIPHIYLQAGYFPVCGNGHDPRQTEIWHHGAP